MSDEMETNLAVLRTARDIYIKKFAEQASTAKSERFEMLMTIIEDRQHATTAVERDIAALADLGVVIVMLHLAEGERSRSQ